MTYSLLGHGWGYPWWPGFLGWIMPLLFLLGIGALAVWAVLRATDRRHPEGAPWAPAQGTPGDAALEQARLRYARGEISREEFFQISADLGADPRASSSGFSRGAEAQAQPEGGPS